MQKELKKNYDNPFYSITPGHSERGSFIFIVYVRNCRRTHLKTPAHPDHVVMNTVAISLQHIFLG